MIKKLQCPFIKSACIREECTLWVSDLTKVTNLKTGKSGVKFNSNCTFYKIGELATQKLRDETEKILED